jgi:hypothetical protein
VLLKVIQSAVSCIPSYKLWELDDVVSMLEWASLNPGKETDLIIQRLRTIHLKPARATALFLGLVNKTFLKKSDHIRVTNALAPVFASACIKVSIGFPDFMSVLNWAKANSSDDSYIVITAISNHLHYGRFTVAELIHVLDWTRTAKAVFTNTLANAFLKIRDCGRSIQLILATYRKDYPDSKLWDESFQNNVLDLVVPPGLECVKNGGLTLEEIVVWMDTASVNKGLGDSELASTFRLMTKCEQPIDLYLKFVPDSSIDLIQRSDLQLPDYSQWKPYIIDEILTHLAYAVMTCLRQYKLSQRTQILQSMRQNSVSLWRTLEAVEYCNSIRELQELAIEEKFTDLHAGLSQAYDKCNTRRETNKQP